VKKNVAEAETDEHAGGEQPGVGNFRTGVHK
jgi:hypothetical protein